MVEIVESTRAGTGEEGRHKQIDQRYISELCCPLSHQPDQLLSPLTTSHKEQCNARRKH